MVPQVMGYAAIAGLPPITGLWASLLPLVVYALMGTSPQLSLGPESTTALLTATALAAMSGGDPDQLAAAAGALAIATGLVCIAARLLRAGYLSTLLSRPILIGYLLGIAVLMVISQLGHLTGLPVPHGSVPTKLGYVLTHLSEINLVTVIMSAATLVVLTTTDTQRLLPTIRSRAVVLRVGRLSDAEVIEVLRAAGHPESEGSALEDRVALAEGSVGAAIALDDIAGAAYQAAYEMISSAVAGRAGVPARLERALRQTPWAARGEFTAMLDALAETLSEAARAAVGETPRRPLPEALRNRRDAAALVRVPVDLLRQPLRALPDFAGDRRVFEEDEDHRQDGADQRALQPDVHG